MSLFRIYSSQQFPKSNQVPLRLLSAKTEFIYKSYLFKFNKISANEQLLNLLPTKEEIIPFIFRKFVLKAERGMLLDTQ